MLMRSRSERRILQRVVEHEGRHPKKCLSGDIAIEVDAQPRLDGAAGRKPAHPHADVAHANAAPLEIGRHVEVFEVPRPKLREIARMDVQTDVVQRPAVEELVGRLRAGDGRRSNNERAAACESCVVPHSVSCKRNTRLQKPARSGIGPIDGRPIVFANRGSPAPSPTGSRAS